jgi:hypothetical protein
MVKVLRTDMERTKPHMPEQSLVESLTRPGAPEGRGLATLDPEGIPQFPWVRGRESEE